MEFLQEKIEFKANVLESRAPESKTAMILMTLDMILKYLFFQILISQNKYPLIGLWKKFQLKNKHHGMSYG